MHGLHTIPGDAWDAARFPDVAPLPSPLSDLSLSPVGMARESLLDAADRFGAMVSPSAKPIERPARVERPVYRLAPSRWPVCPLCGRSVADHDCDEDAVLAALLERQGL